MMALRRIVVQVLVDRLMEGTFTQHDHPSQGLFLDRTYEPLAMGIEIRTPRGQEHRFHPTGLEQRIKRLGEFRVPVMDQVPMIAMASRTGAWCPSATAAGKVGRSSRMRRGGYQCGR